MDNRPDWDSYWLDVAKAISARADCTRRKVGCVIVDKHNRVVSTGYNGGPPKGKSCLKGECPRGKSNVDPGSSYDTGPGSCVALHAEFNALLWADVSRVEGATVYVTDSPCGGCSKLLEGLPLAGILWPTGSWYRGNG
jgi:dCMP deaminase